MKIGEIREKFPQYADIPDGQLARALHEKFYRDMPYADFLKKIDFSQPVNPADEMSFGQRFTAGAGLALTNVGRGVKQIFGGTVEDTKDADRALMRTPGGMAGNVMMNLTTLAPLAVIPGANTIPGAALGGAAIAGLQPSDSGAERAKNMLVGGALGGGVQYAVGPGAQRLGEWAANRQSEAAARQAQNAVRDQTLREGQALGLTTQPSSVNPSTLNNVLESIAGKEALGQQAAKQNQVVVDRVGRAAAGVAPNQAMSEQTLRDARRNMAGPYRELTAISPQAAADMEALKAARLESKLNWRDYGRNQRAESYRAAVQADATAEALEQSLLNQASSVGRSDLLPALREARMGIAQNHSVDQALNVGTGSLDASVFGRMLDRGVPLSGDLRSVAAFQQAFKNPMREASTVPNPGSSKLAAVLSGGLGAGGFAAGGVPGLAAAAIPFTAPPAARALQLSRGLTVAPDYSVSAATNAAAHLADPVVRERLAALARALALPAIPQVNQ